ncbi:MAG: AAA family ATPase [Candidatus Kapabacteria bacterium]|nr:AAA family ATPase [Candidatus Kapabacteria bacterium]
MSKIATKEAKIIAIVNNKGGVGKTTATVHCSTFAMMCASVVFSCH